MALSDKEEDILNYVSNSLKLKDIKPAIRLAYKSCESYSNEFSYLLIKEFIKHSNYTNNSIIKNKVVNAFTYDAILFAIKGSNCDENRNDTLPLIYLLLDLKVIEQYYNKDKNWLDYIVKAINLNDNPISYSNSIDCAILYLLDQSVFNVDYLKANHIVDSLSYLIGKTSTIEKMSYLKSHYNPSVLKYIYKGFKDNKNINEKEKEKILNKNVSRGK